MPQPNDCSTLQRVAPSPEVLRAMQQEFESLLANAAPGLRPHVRLADAHPHQRGFSDGVIYPPNDLPERGISLAAGSPAELPVGPGPVRGVVRVLVLLVDFQDRPFTTTRAHFEQFLFSDRAHSTGSLRDYYTQASYGKVLLTGDVRGPYRMPQPYNFYTGDRSGTGAYPNNAQRMAEDALAAADADVDFALYDPNSDGYVDALVIVHAGPGAEAIPSSDRIHHIWSHKWVLSRRETRDGARLYAYLTVPEDGTLGVYAHELGHLLFQWPDLYDTDYSSAGLGSWCLMAGGSWNNHGDTPALPCAWCKVSQGWADAAEPAAGPIAVPRSADHQRVWKLWSSCLPSAEYFLIENRWRYGFDLHLPGEGLLIYHVDETQPANSQEPHYKVALLQADGLSALEHNANSGDAGDPYPGSSDNRALDAHTTPACLAYAGGETGLAVREVSDAGSIMTARVEREGSSGPTPATPATPIATPGQVTLVPGIGEGRSAKLAGIGILSVADLAAAQPAAVAGALRLSLTSAQSFIDAARTLLA